MLDSSNTSFIPKHTSNKNERRSAPRQMYFGTLIVRILFMAVMIASIGVFVYERRLSNQLAIEVTNFRAAADTYEADGDKLESIISMDKRLLQADGLLKGSVSVVSLFKAIESAVIETVQLVSLELSKEEGDKILLTAGIRTDTFDSTMFQRTVFEENDILQDVALENIAITSATEEGEGFDISDSFIELNALITVEPTDIPAVIVTENSFIPVAETVNVLTPDPASSEADIDIGFGNQ